MIPGFRRVQARTDDINRVLREQIAGIRVVRAFVRERSESTRFATTNDELTDAAISVGQWMALMFPTVMFVFNASSVAVLWFGAGLVGDGSLQIGSLTAFLSYLMQILMAVMMATFVGVLAPRAAVSADRIGEVLDTESSVVPPHDPVTEVTIHGRVELRDVTFCYPGAEVPVLRGVSFAVEPGHTTAIVGSTGAGKTTLVNLIPRLFDVTSGAVLVDGVDVRELDEELLWSRIGGAAERLPVQRHDRQQPALRAAGGDRRGDVGRPRGGPSRRLRPGPSGWPARTRRPGRHELLGRAAAAPGNRQGADPPP
jgi:ATP-binding cassette, subfamily B, multidrug efflux pump